MKPEGWSILEGAIHSLKKKRFLISLTPFMSSVMLIIVIVNLVVVIIKAILLALGIFKD